MLSAYHVLIMGIIWFRLVMKYNENAALPNLQTCKIKPAEQNLVKLYDPIGMIDTRLCQLGLFCSTF